MENIQEIQIRINPYYYPGIYLPELLKHTDNANYEFKKAMRKLNDREYFAMLITAVCSIFMVNVEQLKDKSRLRKFVVARQIIFSLARKNTKMTDASIGEPFFRDHATVLHAEKKINELTVTYLEFARFYAELELALKFKTNYCYLRCPDEIL